MAEHLVSDLLLVCDIRSLYGFEESRIHILSVMGQVKVKRLMVDADTGVFKLLRCEPHPSCEHRCCSLNAVAETCHADIRLCLKIAAEHRHRIGVVEHDSIRAQLLDISDYLEHQRRCSEETENARWSSCISYADVHAVLLRDLDVVSPYIHTALQYCYKHSVRSRQSFRSVCISCHDRIVPTCGNDSLSGLFCILKALLIDVHESYLAVIKCRECHDVPYEVAGEYKRACSYKHYFSHVPDILSI